MATLTTDGQISPLSINAQDSNSFDSTQNHQPRVYSRLQNICNLSCQSWPDRILTTIFVSLCAGVTMLIVGFLVPRSPPSNAKKELPAREYEALVQQYATRAVVMDVVMVMGLGCLLVGAIALSALHVGVYFRWSGFFPLFPVRFVRRSSCNGGNGEPMSSASDEALVLSRAVNYGGLEDTTR